MGILLKKELQNYILICSKASQFRHYFIWTLYVTIYAKSEIKNSIHVNFNKIHVKIYKAGKINHRITCNRIMDVCHPPAHLRHLTSDEVHGLQTSN